jgi:hypothetical protein
MLTCQEGITLMLRDNQVIYLVDTAAKKIERTEFQAVG